MHGARRVVVLVTKLHLCPPHPDGREVVDSSKGDAARLAQDDARILEIRVLLIKLCERQPQQVRLADRPVREGAPREELS